MAVYVDDWYFFYGGKRMCHMIADSGEELHEMARRIGLKREWFQNGTLPHYDVTIPKKNWAISLGAKRIGSKGVAEMIRNHRNSKCL